VRRGRHENGDCGCWPGRKIKSGSTSIVLQDGVDDGWLWHLDPTKWYTVSGDYQLLLSGDPSGGSHFTNITWNKVVPLKVTIFA
jgi:hypothetical protein